MVCVVSVFPTAAVASSISSLRSGIQPPDDYIVATATSQKWLAAFTWKYQTRNYKRAYKWRWVPVPKFGFAPLLINQSQKCHFVFALFYCLCVYWVMYLFTYCNLDTSFLILVRNKIKSGKIPRAKARRTFDNTTC